MRLKNEVAVITGAGSGMGRSMARLFAQEGAKVVAADIQDKGVLELIAESKDLAGEIVFCQVDVSNRQQVEAMIDFAVERYGRLDILVNNAGIMDNMAGVADVEDERWDRVLAINLNGVMYGCRHAIPIMEKQPEGGRIVNTASIGGLQGTRAGAAYTASKFAVVGLTQNIGFMYAQKKIRCNAVCPGSVETNIGMSMMQNLNEFGMKRATAGAGVSPRNGSPDEIAQVALFLASKESSFVNGTTVTADGGWTAY